MAIYKKAVVLDVDLNDFSTQELKDELYLRGESVDGIDNYEDDELIVKIESRGVSTYDKGHIPNIQNLYSTYTTMSPEFFEKELKRFFREQLDVNEY